MAIKILLVSKDILLREGLRCLFKQKDDLELVAEAARGEEVQQQVQECLPDVVLMDIALPDGDAPKVADWIRKTYPQVKIVVWSYQSYPDNVFTMLRAGASGILVKDFTYEEMVKAVRRVVSQQAYLNPMATRIFVERFQQIPDKKSLLHPTLTTREQEVLKLLVSGITSAQIAEQLNIRPKTVESHRSNLMKKLGLKTVAEVTKYAIQTGFMS